MAPRSPTRNGDGAQLVAATYLAIGILGFIPLEEVNPYCADEVGAVYLLRHIAVNGLLQGVDVNQDPTHDSRD